MVPYGTRHKSRVKGDDTTHLRQLLLTQRTLGVVVQAPLQTLQAEGVATRSRHRLKEESGEKIRWIRAFHVVKPNPNNPSINRSNFIYATFRKINQMLFNVLCV